MRVFLYLFSLISASKSANLCSTPCFLGNLEKRRILLEYWQTFYDFDMVTNKSLKWLKNYGKLKNFPHYQKLLLDVKYFFPAIDTLSDPRIMEAVETFYEFAKEDQRTLLESLFQDTFITDYLMEGGFSFGDFSLRELADMAPSSDYFEFKSSPFVTVPELQGLIDDWPEIEGHFNNINIMKEVLYLLKEKIPTNLIVDMLKMNIRDLKIFSKLPIITNDKIRFILLPIFEMIPQFREMPNVFKRLSNYPGALKCLGIVWGPRKQRKIELIILFPYHTDPTSCDAIIDLDLRDKVGGWRRIVYKPLDYFAFWIRDPRFFDRMATLDQSEVRDRMILDKLCVSALISDPHNFDELTAKGHNMVRLIVEEVEQCSIYQIFNLKGYYDNQLDSDLEEKIWDKIMDQNQSHPNIKVSLLLYLLVPRLFPGQVSKIAMSIHVDNSMHTSPMRYVDSIIEAGFLAGNQAEIKSYTIESLQRMFEIQIDPSILNDLNCSRFEKFANFAYKRVKKANIQFINIGKLLNLSQNQRSPLPRKVILGEIASRISNAYSENIPQTKFIEKLINLNVNCKIYYDKLKEMEDVPEYLNFLYSLVDPVVFFRDYSILSIYSNIDEILNSDSFGINFLKDMVNIVPNDGDQL